jgi:hypothetical protein
MAMLNFIFSCIHLTKWFTNYSDYTVLSSQCYSVVYLFTAYLTTLSVAQAIVMSARKKWIVNWNSFGQMWSHPNLSYYAGICREDWD